MLVRLLPQIFLRFPMKSTHCILGSCFFCESMLFFLLALCHRRNTRWRVLGWERTNLLLSPPLSLVFQGVQHPIPSSTVSHYDYLFICIDPGILIIYWKAHQGNVTVRIWEKPEACPFFWAGCIPKDKQNRYQILRWTVWLLMLVSLIKLSKVVDKCSSGNSP